MVPPGPSVGSREADRWLALALLCSAQFMVMFDEAVVNVALPSIQPDLHFSAASIQWVFTAYLLAFGGLLMLGGRTADLLGRRRMFMIGAGLLCGASVFAGLSWSQGTLIAARGLMGVGAAVITPAALSIILGLFADGSERNRALGIWERLSASPQLPGCCWAGSSLRLSAGSGSSFSTHRSRRRSSP